MASEGGYFPFNFVILNPVVKSRDGSRPRQFLRVFFRFRFFR